MSKRKANHPPRKVYDVSAPGPKPPSPWPVFWGIVGIITFTTILLSFTH
jgi:hypothetical protein